AIILFRDTTKELESQHLRSDFAYASHQLRTPVAEALGSLEVSIEETDPTKQKENLEIAYSSLLSVAKLANNMVEVSMIDQGNVFAAPVETKISDAVTDTVTKLEAELEDRGVKVVNNVSPDLTVETDPTMLRKVLLE